MTEYQKRLGVVAAVSLLGVVGCALLAWAVSSFAPPIMGIVFVALGLLCLILGAISTFSFLDAWVEEVNPKKQRRDL